MEESCGMQFSEYGSGSIHQLMALLKHYQPGHHSDINRVDAL